MPTFPVSAVLLQDGFGIERDSAVNRTSMEDGMVKQLKMKSRVLVARSVKYGFRLKADYLAFIVWYQTDINEGADWFDWIDPVDSVTKLARIVSRLSREEPDDPMLTWWTVTFTLETWSV